MLNDHRGGSLVEQSPGMQGDKGFIPGITGSDGSNSKRFNDLGLSRLGFEHPTFRLRGKRSNPLRHRRGKKKFNRVVI